MTSSSELPRGKKIVNRVRVKHIFPNKLRKGKTTKLALEYVLL